MSETGSAAVWRRETSEARARAADAEERAARAEMELRRVVDVMHEAAGGREGETVPDALRRLLRESDEARDGLFRIASALGMIDGEHGRYVVASVDQMVPAIGRLIEERDRGDDARDELRAVHAALGAHVSEGDLAADVERVRVAFDLRISLVHTVNAERDEARGVVRSLLDGHASPRDEVRRAAIDAATAAVKRWDAPTPAPVSPAPLAVGDRVRVLRVSDDGNNELVGCTGEVTEVDQGCDGLPYRVRFVGVPGTPETWFREGELERVAVTDSIADAVRKAVHEGGVHAHRGRDGQVRGWVGRADEALEADGAVTLHPTFTRIGDEDDGSPA